MLVYNEFDSAVTQRVSVVQLLPIIPPEPPRAGAGSLLPVAYEYEPDCATILADLLPRYLANKVWQALLESVAAENAARMTAMENATSNAAEMISKLTQQFNRTRQAMITKELVEIVSGAEALK
jgi:F-type H+-transporting ATPase subunit gamma